MNCSTEPSCNNIKQKKIGITTKNMFVCTSMNQCHLLNQSVKKGRNAIQNTARYDNRLLNSFISKWTINQ